MRGRLAFLSSVRERTRGYILIPLEVKSGSPRTICPFPRRVLPFASGSLARRSKSKPRIDLRRSERAREPREKFGGDLVSLQASFRSFFLSPSLSFFPLFFSFCPDRPQQFCFRYVFSSVSPAFYAVPAKNGVWRSRGM